MRTTFTYDELTELHRALNAAKDALESIRWATAGLTPDSMSGPVSETPIAEAYSWATLLHSAAGALVDELDRLGKLDELELDEPDHWGDCSCSNPYCQA